MDVDDDWYRAYKHRDARLHVAAMLWEQGVGAELLWRKFFRDGKQQSYKQKSFMAELIDSLESRRDENLEEKVSIDGPYLENSHLIVLHRRHDLTALTGECTW